MLMQTFDIVFLLRKQIKCQAWCDSIVAKTERTKNLKLDTTFIMQTAKVTTQTEKHYIIKLLLPLFYFLTSLHTHHGLLHTHTCICRCNHAWLWNMNTLYSLCDRAVSEQLLRHKNSTLRIHGNFCSSNHDGNNHHHNDQVARFAHSPTSQCHVNYHINSKNSKMKINLLQNIKEKFSKWR